MKTMIDVDDALLQAAQRELGTTTKKDTVNAALKFAAERGLRTQQTLDDLASKFGVGEDIANTEVMKDARR